MDDGALPGTAFAHHSMGELVDEALPGTPLAHHSHAGAATPVGALPGTPLAHHSAGEAAAATPVVDGALPGTPLAHHSKGEDAAATPVADGALPGTPLAHHSGVGEVAAATPVADGALPGTPLAHHSGVGEAAVAMPVADGALPGTPVAFHSGVGEAAAAMPVAPPATPLAHHAPEHTGEACQESTQLPGAMLANDEPAGEPFTVAASATSSAVAATVAPPARPADWAAGCSSSRVGIAGIDQAPSGRAMCRGCSGRISKGSWRFLYWYSQSRPVGYLHAACVDRCPDPPARLINDIKAIQPTCAPAGEAINVALNTLGCSAPP